MFGEERKWGVRGGERKDNLDVLEPHSKNIPTKITVSREIVADFPHKKKRELVAVHSNRPMISTSSAPQKQLRLSQTNRWKQKLEKC